MKFIKLTSLPSDKAFFLNPEAIASLNAVASTHSTLIVLATGQDFEVKESVEYILETLLKLDKEPQ